MPMHLYPKTISPIARESIQILMQDGNIEVEAMRVADAEMDLSAIMREYLTNEERVNQATREALERRGDDHSRFNQVKREMADVRGFKLGDEGIAYLIDQMVEFLLLSRNVEEVFASDDVLRDKLRAVMAKHLRDEPARPPDSGSGPGSVPPASAGGGPTGAPATAGDEPPAPSAPSGRNDGFDLD